MENRKLTKQQIQIKSSYRQKDIYELLLLMRNRINNPINLTNLPNILLRNITQMVAKEETSQLVIPMTFAEKKDYNQLERALKANSKLLLFSSPESDISEKSNKTLLQHAWINECYPLEDILMKHFLKIDEGHEIVLKQFLHQFQQRKPIPVSKLYKNIILNIFNAISDKDNFFCTPEGSLNFATEKAIVNLKNYVDENMKRDNHYYKYAIYCLMIGRRSKIEKTWNENQLSLFKEVILKNLKPVIPILDEYCKWETLKYSIKKIQSQYKESTVKEYTKVKSLKENVQLYRKNKLEQMAQQELIRKDQILREHMKFNTDEDHRKTKCVIF